ncbi:MAG: HEAT repeat domain-containing protein [Planctomycetales bacterium]|nr:HEAT repeat domain-containing protein [Planctomycetales bacterium]
MRRTVVLVLAAAGCASWPEERMREIAKLEDGRVREGGRLAELLGKDPDRRVRAAAATALGRGGTPSDTSALLAALDDRSGEVVLAALFALGQLRDGDARAVEAVPALLRLAAGSREEDLRATAIEALGKIGDAERSAGPVAALLGDPSPAIRGEAALALFRMPALERALDVARAAAREEDPEALWRMVYAVAALRNPRQRRGKATPPPLDDAGREALLLALRRATGLPGDPHRYSRTYGASGLGRVLGDSAGPDLARLVLDPDWIVRVSAIRAAAKAMDDATTRTLRAVAGEDPHPLVRETALEQLAERKGAETEAVVERCLRDRSRTVQRAALGTWAALRGAEALPAIRAALSSDSPYVRASAIGAAGATLAGPKGERDKARADLEGIRKKPDAAATEAAAAEEAAARASATHVAASVPVAEFLLGVFEKGDLRDRAAVMGALETLDLAGACDLAERGLAVADLAVRGGAAELLKGRAEEIAEAKRDVVTALVDAFRGSSGREWYETRVTMLQALTALKDDRAVPVLREALNDPYKSVREAAAAGLKALRDETITPPTLPPPADVGAPDPKETRARVPQLARRLRIETTKGPIVLDLFPEEAPVHVANIAALADAGRYDGLAFHRVVPAFVIQGGDPRGDGWGDAGYAIRDEVNPRVYSRGTLGMPNAGPDTGGCQLFITHLSTPHLDGNYTVFGRLADAASLEVVDRIEVGDVIVRARTE